MSNKHCSICEHLQTYGKKHGPYTWSCCDEIKKAVAIDDELYMSYIIVNVREEALGSFYCKHFTRRK